MTLYHFRYLLNVDMEEILEKLMQSDQTNKQLSAILKVADEFEDYNQNDDKNDAWLAIA